VTPWNDVVRALARLPAEIREFAVERCSFAAFSPTGRVADARW